MIVTDYLASSSGRRDEAPNQELAMRIADAEDKSAIKELIKNLDSKNKEIQSDCIKVLYEIGQRKPALIAPHTLRFIDLLDSKNNRLQWGAMTALNSIAPENPRDIFKALPLLTAAAEQGSVITRDSFVGILIKLCIIDTYADDAFLLLNGQLLSCPANQLPMYAELALSAINEKNKSIFTRTLITRLSDLQPESKRRRIEKVLKKLQG